MKSTILLVMLVFISIPTFAMEDYQKKVLTYAYKYGNRIQYLNQGWGETVTSIVYQESKGGKSIYLRNGVVVGDRNSKGKYKSLGVMQVQLPAARDVQRWYPIVFKSKFGNYNPTDEELIYALLSDYRFNISVGSWYFIKMLELTGNWRQAILAYNTGLNNNGNDPNDYVNKVLRWRKTIVPQVRNLIGG